MTVSPYYPLLHPSELEFPIQQVVIMIPPLPKANDNVKDNQDDYQEDYQEGSVTSYSSEEGHEDWEVSSLDTESEADSSDLQYLADHDDDDDRLLPSFLGTTGIKDCGDSAVEVGQKGKRVD